MKMESVFPVQKSEIYDLRIYTNVLDSRHAFISGEVRVS
jgi:hypothetical protein